MTTAQRIEMITDAIDPMSAKAFVDAVNAKEVARIEWDSSDLPADSPEWGSIDKAYSEALDRMAAAYAAMVTEDWDRIMKENGRQGFAPVALPAAFPMSE